MKKMFGEELNNYLLALEYDLQSIISQRIYEFYVDTGLTISELKSTFTSSKYKGIKTYCICKVEVTAT